MRQSAIGLAALFLGFASAASAQDGQGLRVGSQDDIRLVVLCSQYPELDAAYLRQFLEARLGKEPPALIVDGFDAVPKTMLDDPQVRKALLFAAKREPDQAAMDCVRAGVAFDQLVFDLASPGWDVIGLRADDPANPLHATHSPLLRSYTPTDSVTRFRNVAEGNWTVATTATAEPFPQHMDSALEGSFDLDPR